MPGDRMNRNLSEGNPAGVLIRFALPLLGSMLFQQLYNIADSFVAGRFIGENALAAVGNSYEITLIFIAFAFGCNMGASVLVSQYYGAGRLKEMRSAITTSAIAVGILAIALTILGMLFTDPLLELINTPEEIIEDSAVYLDIYIIGLLFLFFYNLATGIFTAMGDSRTPFIFLALSSTANIFADILFVTAFGMGVDGVAWATFICQGLSCIAACIAIVRRLRATVPVSDAPLFDTHIFRRFLIVAIPSVMQQSFVSVGNIIVQSVVNSFGASVIAGYSAAIKLNNMCVTSITTLGNAVSSFSAQNVGARDFARAKKGFRIGVAMTYAFCIPVFILFFFCSRTVLLLFLEDGGSEAARNGIAFLRIVSPFYFVVSLKIISDAVIRGAGDMTPFMISTFSDLILRVGLAIIFSAFWGSVGIWLSWPVGWAVGAIVSLIFLKSGHWIRYAERNCL